MVRGATSTSLLRRANAQLVLEVLRDGQSWSGRELRRQTGLSQPTVDAVVEDLIGHGLVETTVGEPAQRGRPARKLVLRASARYVVGVDVQSRRARATAADLFGQILAAASRPLTAKMGRAQRLSGIVDAINDVSQRGRGDEEPAAVVVGTPGAVDPVSGRVGMCGVLAEWSHFSLQEVLASALGSPVTIENDTNLAALGEAWRGAAAGCDHAIVFLVGKRPGAGILTRGEPYHGHKGWAGEMFLWSLWYEHYRGSPTVPVRASDRQLDLLAQRAVRRRGGVSARRTRFQDTGTPIIDLELALAALAAGDAQARQAVRSFIAGGAHVTIDMVSLLGPERVVVGGMPDPMALPVLQIWQEALDKSVADNPTELRLSRLGDEAVTSGAIRCALNAAQDLLLP